MNLIGMVDQSSYFINVSLQNQQKKTVLEIKISGTDVLNSEGRILKFRLLKAVLHPLSNLRALKEEYCHFYKLLTDFTS
jgi:hypothetical protein